MTIILGAGIIGQEILGRFFQGKNNNVVFYDNDRRKWGQRVLGREVVSLERLLDLVKQRDTEIIIAVRNKTVYPFLKDICQPYTVLWSVIDDTLVPFELNTLGENYQWREDPAVFEQKRLDTCIRAKESFAQQKNIAAYNHAVDYINFKREHLLLPDIDSVELTNCCNLRCPNCATTTAKFPKGYMSEEVFDLALKHLNPAGNCVELHGMGEPLLHPRFIQCLEQMEAVQINASVSTNAVLLDKNLSHEMFSIMGRMNKAIFLISFHTKKSVENWLHCLEDAKKHPNISFAGQVLEHNKDQAHEWLREFGISQPELHPYIRYVASHSWAGNVEGRKSSYSKIEISNRIRNCYYLKNRIVRVKWNGIITGCCLDAECTENCGTIFDLENVRINPDGYQLCAHCDPGWVSDFQ